MKEAVSIVVPVFNREDLILRCLESIFSQTYRPLRLIVVDNGSVDSTWERTFKWLSDHNSEDFSTALLSEPAKGASAARNRGLGNVETDKVMFFDSDDTMRPGCVEKAMDIFSGHPHCEIVAWAAEMHFLNGKTRKTKISGRNPMETHILHGLLRPQGYMAKTSLVRRAGGWNENLPSWNDWELGVRLMLLSPSVSVIKNEVLADIYSQKDSITGTSFIESEGKWELSLDCVGREISGSCHPEKRRLMRLVAYRTVILGALYHKEGSSQSGKRLLEAAVRGNSLSSWQRLVLTLAYHYTRLGGRGAYLFACL